MPVERFTISLEDSLVADLDRVRGPVQRSTAVAEAVKLWVSLADGARTARVLELPVEER